MEVIAEKGSISLSLVLQLQLDCRLAIRAASLGPEGDKCYRQWLGKLSAGISKTEEKRGSFEGAIRISLHVPSFPFNSLVFLRIPRKSLKFRSSLFSIHTTQAVFAHPHCTASTVSLSPIALVTAT